LLQLPHLELTEFLNQELMENPFLEESADEVPAEELAGGKESVEEEDNYEDAGGRSEKLLNFTLMNILRRGGLMEGTWDISTPAPMNSPPSNSFFGKSLICTITSCGS
jgi:DNA-directed RNA polymerase specialized sigma54-like protein